MMKKYYRSIMAALLLSFTIATTAQTVVPRLVVHLPDTLVETSGIEVVGPNNIWTHNDSGDKPRIFQVDTNGAILRTLWLSLDSVVDCEDITRDDSGNFYLGDFGNNTHDRQDLRIYKFPDPVSNTGDTVMPQLIRFQYPDQYLFPPDSNHKNFDCEAMFHYRDSLYIFSKNWGTSGFSRMYRLPDQPGNYVAELLDSFNTGLWVTSADISPSGETMILFSETRIRLFNQYEGCRFFNGSCRELTISSYTQKEAIAFIDDSSVYITDEQLWGTGGNLYFLDLSPWLSAIHTVGRGTHNVELFPNPVGDYFYIQRSDPSVALVRIELRDAEGHLINADMVCEDPISLSPRYSLPNLSSGLYLLYLYFEDGGCSIKKFIIGR